MGSTKDHNLGFTDSKALVRKTEHLNPLGRFCFIAKCLLLGYTLPMFGLLNQQLHLLSRPYGLRYKICSQPFILSNLGLEPRGLDDLTNLRHNVDEAYPGSFLI